MQNIAADLSWLCHFAVVGLILIGLSAIVVFFKVFHYDLQRPD